MRHVTRRQFVKGSVYAGLGMAMAGPMSRVRGANDEIRVAVIGVNGRGGSHISEFEEMEGVRVVALCDVDQKVLNGKAAAFEKKYGHAVEKYVDLRKLLENKDVIMIGNTKLKFEMPLSQKKEEPKPEKKPIQIQPIVTPMYTSGTNWTMIMILTLLGLGFVALLLLLFYFIII